MNNQYNVLIDVVGTLLVGAIFVFENGQKRRGDPMSARLLRALMLCCTLVFLCDIPGLLLDGMVFPGVRTLLWLVDIAYWVFQIVYCWLWLLFADYWVNGSVTRLKKLLPVYAIPMLAEIILIAVNPVTGWIFTIDGVNVYERGSLYLLNMIPYCLYIGGALSLTVVGCFRAADAEERRNKLSLAIYMFLPICGVFFDAFVYGISWVWPMVALSLLMVYLNVQQQTLSDDRLAAAKLESELAESRVAIMLTQIQPHFLYNALSSIHRLCEIDPAAAQCAIDDFSQYLRVNLSSLNHASPIPFTEELRHVQTYLNLEKMRFQDLLEIVYDIQTTGFLIPSLTVQTLAENAVKHGVGQLEDGGTVYITTREYPDRFEITVADNGAGFDPDKPKDDGGTHIGIENVRARLRVMCGGSLSIKSAENAGTTATITLPREG